MTDGAYVITQVITVSTTGISGDVEKMRGLANTLTPMEIVESWGSGRHF